MTRIEFAKVMAYLEAAISKPLDADRAEVYFDLLGDLPAEVLQTAAKKVALEHKWASFPTVAELRQAASETLQGVLTLLSPAEAWEQAWSAVKRIDPDIEGSVDRALANVHPLVAEAMGVFSIRALVYGKEPVGVIRGQFMKMFEQLADREKRKSLLPPALAQNIKAIGEKRKALPPSVGKAIGKIGLADEQHDLRP